MFSKFFINRPIFATVVAILMIIVGVVALKSLPVAQFPSITPPTVMVSATYPGADATTVAQTVGVPIEEQVNGVEGMMYMSSSSSSNGSYSLTITFENGTDLDMAAVKVQNRIALAENSLPSSVKQQGVSVVSKSSNIVLFIALTTDNPEQYDALYLTNYAKLNLVDELARVSGVGGVDVFGAGEYSMRVWLDPERMRVRGLTTDDVITMIKSQNMAVSAGSVGAPPDNDGAQFQFTLTANGRLTTADEFAEIILRTNSDGSMLRLGDIARVELGSQSYGQSSRVSGQETALIAVNQLPGANALDVAHGVEKKLKELARYFPEDVRYQVVMDTTEFVDASIDEVLMTFLETTLIVMIVIMLFLANWRAVIIPMLTIPVSLIATFAVMKLLDFSINTLTLFGLVLAIAIVVDDAIVVVEDCVRLINKERMKPKEAAIKAMSELHGPIVGEVLVLMSVFIPTAFISGITGELYKQFALTIAISTAFSGINALTFTPAMCALFLKPNTDNPKFFIYRWFDRVFGWLSVRYDRTLGRIASRPVMAVIVFILISSVAFWGFVKMPTSYVPEEDMGYFMTSVQLPTGASLERTDSVLARMSRFIAAQPEVKDVISVAGTSFVGGGSTGNVGSMFTVLKPWKERRGERHSVDGVIARVDSMSATIQEAVIFSINPPAIPGLGMTSGLEMKLLDINNLGAEEMAKALDDVRAKAESSGLPARITSLYEGVVPQFKVSIDRDKVKMAGVTLDDVNSALSSFMGGTYVNDFVRFGRVYEVNVAAIGEARSNEEDVLKLSVRNSDGEMVPFSTFATITPSMGESTVSRYNMYSAVSLTATPNRGVSSSRAITEMENLVTETLGQNYAYAWTGEAFQETQAGTTVSIVLIFAVIVTILVLAAQYESWIDPLAVVIMSPTAILGTLAGCLIMSQSISIYTQIGIILLLGMSAKNAILIVEYARDYRAAGQSVSEAALHAGSVRFRPILMTSLAFIFGIMPMLYAEGAGAASRVSLGTAVVFGMALNALFSTLLAPTFWELMHRPLFRSKR
jgi:hydrophobe/amphiphile efflux-1 (HAE1) family protein